MSMETAAARLAARSKRLENGCVVWTGAKQTSGGHGRILVAGKSRGAHRVAWIVANGPVPNGLCVLHDCPAGDNPACINLDHLYLGTPKDNADDRTRKGRHRCGRGESQGRAKLRNAQVRVIFRDRRASWVVALEYGVSSSTVRGIRNGATWRHVTGAP